MEDYLIGSGRGGRSIRGMQLKVESIDQPKIVPSYSFYHPWAETVVCRTEVVEIGGALERETVAGLFTILWSLFLVFFPYRATEYSVLNLSIIVRLVRLGYCFTPYQRLRLHNGAPFSRLLRHAGDKEDVLSA